MRKLLYSLVTLTLLVASRSWAVTLVPDDVIVTGTGSVGTGLIRVDPVSGQQTLITSGSFVDFTLADRQTIYAVEGGAIVEVDVTTGAKSTTSAGGLLSDPRGIAVVQDQGLYVLDYGTSGGDVSIVRIESQSGSQSLITAGGLLTNERQISVSSSWFDLEARGPNEGIVLQTPAYASNSSEIVSVDIQLQTQERLFDEDDVPCQACAYLSTGLFVSSLGDVVFSDGTVHSTGVY